MGEFLWLQISMHAFDIQRYTVIQILSEREKKEKFTHVPDMGVHVLTY